MKAVTILMLTLARVAMAEDLPFWGPESSGATNLVSTVSASLDATVESRAFTWLTSGGIDFSSCPVGFLLFFK